MGIQNVSQTYSTVALRLGQTPGSFFRKVGAWRSDPEFFEKVCQVAMAAIQLLMAECPGKEYLTRFNFALSTSLLHDFYSFLKQPRQWFFPVTIDRIDENGVKNSLITVLQAQLDPTGSHVTEIQQLAETCLAKRLTYMREKEDAYRSADEFKQVLQIQIRNMGQSVTPFDCSTIDLTNLDVKLRHISFGERLTNLNWSIVDVGCVAVYFNEWKLINLSNWAQQIGTIPGFAWIKNRSLDAWVLGMVCSGFALKLYEATRKLFDEAMTEQERTKARVDVATSTTELVLYGTMFLNRIGQSSIDLSVIQWMTIISKSFGLYCIATRKSHVYFQPKIAAAA